MAEPIAGEKKEERDGTEQNAVKPEEAPDMDMEEADDSKEDGTTTTEKATEDKDTEGDDDEDDEEKKGEEAEEKMDEKDDGDGVKNEDADDDADDDAKPATKNEEKKEKPKKKKYTNWPLKEIKEPHENDVLYGRGGGTNHHPGNKRYRKMVEDRKLDYVSSKRLDKPLVALDIIRIWREQDPPGRFLKLDEKTGLWLDVGDKKAREKTSQALREKAPEIRRKQEEDDMIKAGKDPSTLKDKDPKSTRFAAGTKDKQRDKMKHAVLARDHSLGREYMNPGEAVTLDGFTWDPAMLDRVSSYGSVSGGVGAVYPPGRITSQGSQGVPPPYFPPSRTGSHSSGAPGGPPPVPPPGSDYYRSMSHEERNRSFVRYDSWARMQSGGSVGSHIPPPPPPPPPHSPMSPYGGGSPYQHRMGSFGPGPMSRDHSLSNNPLRDASIGQPANPSAFARGGSGYWDPRMPPPPPPPHGHGSMPPSPVIGHGSMPPSPVYGGPRYDSYGRPMSAAYDPHGPPPPAPRAQHSPPPPPGRSYQLDPAIAQSWSGQSVEDYEKAASVLSDDVQASWSGDEGAGTTFRQKIKPGTTFPEQHAMARPDMVKRMTSNQNEDMETRPDVQGDGRSIRRAALSRDKSAASNRLKEQFASGALSKRPMPLERDMRALSKTMAESSLDTKPKSLTAGERTSTMENITMELTKPTALTADTRTTTIEALSIDLDLETPSGAEPPIPKPPALRTEGRMSTAEYNDIVNEPLGLDQEVGKPLELNREASVSEWLLNG